MRALRIGLTGGIATGKSTVLAAFKRLGAATLSADEVAHELLAEPLWARRVARRFGEEVVGRSGRVDRKALGRRVFGRPRELRALERILHPEIRRRMESAARKRREAVVVSDVPLLFEKGLAGRYDLTLLVYASEAEQERRLRRRDGLSRDEARRRVRLQWPIDRKAGLADVVVDNGPPWRRVRPVVREYHRAFELLASGAAKARAARKRRT